MKYSIEIGKIVEGALRRDSQKVINYTKQLSIKLQNDGDLIASNKFIRLLDTFEKSTLSIMGSTKEILVPVDSESRTDLADIVFPNDNNIEVILTNNNSEKLKSFILNHKNADKLNTLGIGVSNTLLLYGPPGCGKTKCAYLIAKELDLPLVIARIDSLISSYLGTTSKNIRSLFDFAQKIPCVLFLDEFDAVAKARDDNNELGELKRVVNSLLQNVDSMSSDSLLIAATNHEKLLDTAVWRRFDYKLEIELPDINAIIKMLDLFTKNTINLNEKEKNELSYVLIGLSGSDIEEIITKALRNSIVHNLPFTKNRIYEELFTYSNILSQDMYDNKDILKVKANYLRKKNEKIFSLQVIADILESSKTTIQKIVKEDN